MKSDHSFPNTIQSYTYFLSLFNCNFDQISLVCQIYIRLLISNGHDLTNSHFIELFSVVALQHKEYPIIFVDFFSDLYHFVRPVGVCITPGPGPFPLPPRIPEFYQKDIMCMLCIHECLGMP